MSLVLLFYVVYISSLWVWFELVYNAYANGIRLDELLLAKINGYYVMESNEELDHFI